MNKFKVIFGDILEEFLILYEVHRNRMVNAWRRARGHTKGNSDGR